MKYQPDYGKGSRVGFVDLIQNTLVGFIILFIIAFMMIKPVDDKPEIVKKAELMITVTWNMQGNDDVDSWLEPPGEKSIYFKNKITTVAHLDRDDLGHSTDTIRLGSGEEKIIYINQEITTIRGIYPGEWTFNVHMFAKRDKEPCNVVVTFDKLNPYQRIKTKEVVLKKKGQEETVFRFTMDENGNIVNINEIPKKLVDQQVINTYDNNSDTGGY